MCFSDLLEYYDADIQDYPLIPCYLIFDEEGRKLGPVGIPIVNDEIALAIPYNVYCSDAAKCEAHRTSSLFGKLDTIDPRWSALKAFKVQN